MRLKAKNWNTNWAKVKIEVLKHWKEEKIKWSESLMQIQPWVLKFISDWPLALGLTEWSQLVYKWVMWTFSFACFLSHTLLFLEYFFLALFNSHTHIHTHTQNAALNCTPICIVSLGYCKREQNSLSTMLTM